MVIRHFFPGTLRLTEASGVTVFVEIALATEVKTAIEVLKTVLLSGEGVGAAVRPPVGIVVDWVLKISEVDDATDDVVAGDWKLELPEVKEVVEDRA